MTAMMREALARFSASIMISCSMIVSLTGAPWVWMTNATRLIPTGLSPIPEAAATAVASWGWHDPANSIARRATDTCMGEPESGLWDPGRGVGRRLQLRHGVTGQVVRQLRERPRHRQVLPHPPQTGVPGAAPRRGARLQRPLASRQGGDRHGFRALFLKAELHAPRLRIRRVNRTRLAVHGFSPPLKRSERVETNVLPGSEPDTAETTPRRRR